MAVSITEFQLDEFGGEHPLQVLDLGSGLNVALVHDDESRAQLLQVIPWTLYGPGPYFREADGSVVAPGSAALATLGTDHGVFTIERAWGSHPDEIGSPATQPPPVVTSGDGELFPPEYLEHILEKLPSSTYREVFTFELDRLRRIVRSDSFGGERLTRLANYLLRKPLSASKRVVVPSELAQFQARLGDLAAMIEQRTLLPPANSSELDDPQPGSIDSNKLQRELKKLDADLLEIHGKTQHVREEIDETECAMDLMHVQQRLSEVNRELSKLRPKKSKGEDASVHPAAERLEEKIAAVRDEIRDLATEREDLKRQAKELGNLKRVQQLMPQVDAMLVQEKSLVREETAIEQLKAQLHDFEARVESERLHAATKVAAKSSGSWSESHVAHRMEAFADRFREIERELRLDEERLQRAESAGNRTADHLARASAFTSHPEEAVAIHEAEQRLTSLREMAGMDDQLSRLELEREELQSKMRRLYARQLLPFQMAMALGVPFMIGVAMIIYGLVMATGQTNWQLVILGFALTILTALIKTTLDRGTTESLHAARQRLSRVEFQIDEFAAAHHSTGAEGLSLARQIEQAERELQRLQTRFAAKESRSSLSSTELTQGMSSIESARIQLNDARRREQELQQQWREFLIETDLSPNLTPDHAREILVERAAHARPLADTSPIQNLEFQIEQLRGETNRRQDWLASITNQAKQLIKELGYSISGGGVSECIDLLREAQRAHRDRVQARRQIAHEIQRLRQKQLRVKESGRRLSEQRRQLDEEMRTKKARLKQAEDVRNEQMKLLEKQRERLKNELAEIKDRHGVTDSPLTELSGEELQSRLENQQSRLARLHERTLKLSEQRGRCRGLLSLTKQVSVHGNGEEPRDNWSEVLESARNLQEQCEMQAAHASAARPGQTLYLNQASDYLRQLSAGQFVEISVTVEDQVRLIDHLGQSLGLDDIRREHFANIYFSLWLARIESYANRGLRLPVVMEDPLVATDPTRRPLVAQLLAEFATRGHQVILVTSNSDNAELFARWNVPIADFSDREIEQRSHDSPESNFDSEIDQPHDSFVEWSREGLVPNAHFSEELPPHDAKVSPEPLFPRID